MQDPSCKTNEKQSHRVSQQPNLAVLHRLDQHARDCLLPSGRGRFKRRELWVFADDVFPAAAGKGCGDVGASLEEQRDGLDVPAGGRCVERVGLPLQAEAPTSATIPPRGSRHANPLGRLERESVAAGCIDMERGDFQDCLLIAAFPGAHPSLVLVLGHTQPKTEIDQQGWESECVHRFILDNFLDRHSGEKKSLHCCDLPHQSESKANCLEKFFARACMASPRSWHQIPQDRSAPWALFPHLLKYVRCNVERHNANAGNAG